MLTFFLMLVIMAVATDTRAVGEAAAIAIGGTVGLVRPRRRARQRCVDEPGPLARAGASSRRAGALWIYLLAPLLGASLGALAYQLLRGEHARPAAVGDNT